MVAMVWWNMDGISRWWINSIDYMGTMYLSRKNRPISDDSALNIAKGRYARGEITKEEYEQFRKDL